MKLASELATAPAGAVLLDLLEQHVCDGLQIKDARTALPSKPSDLRTKATIRDRRVMGSIDLSPWLIEALAHVNESGDPEVWGASSETVVHRLPVADELIENGLHAAWTRPLSKEQWLWSRGPFARSDNYWNKLSEPPQWGSSGPRFAFVTTSPLSDDWESYETFLEDAWDLGLSSEKVSRFKLQTRSSCKVLEIRGADDLRAALASYDRDSTGFYSEIGVKVQPEPDAESRFMSLDWFALRAQWDAVHFTWWAIATMAYAAVSVTPSSFTSLLGFGGEASIWLAPSFAGNFEPHPIPSRLYLDGLEAFAIGWKPLTAQIESVLSSKA